MLVTVVELSLSSCFVFGLDLVINWMSFRLDVFDVQALVLLFRSLPLVQRFFGFYSIVKMVNRYSMLFPGAPFFWALQVGRMDLNDLKSQISAYFDMLGWM